MPVGSGAIHFLPESNYLFPRDERICVAVAYQNTRLHRIGFGGGAGIQQAMKTCDGGKVRAISREFKDRLSAHTESDRALP